MRLYLQLCLLWVGASCFSGCGEKSFVACPEDGEKSQIGSNCVEKTPDEEAMLALNAGDFEGAIAILEPLVAESPEAYFRIPRLATAYASLAGLDLFNAVSLMQEGEEDSDGESGGIDGLSAFIPALDPDNRDDYLQKILYMENAKDLLLNDMPPEERHASEELFYGASAELQLFLYRTSYSMMQMNYFVVPLEPGSNQLDESVLEELTAEQALDIIENLRGSVSDIVANSDNPQLQASADKLGEAVAEIENEEGGDLGEKLQNYLKKEQAEQ